MKKAKVVSAIVLPVLLIVAILAVSVYAVKPQPEPEPQPISISVTGAIEGVGNPHTISVKLKDPSFGEEVGEFVANPDGDINYNKGALLLLGTNGQSELKYYYCDSVYHSPTDGLCNVLDHDPDNYKCVQIFNGRYDRKTGQVFFRAGSRWRLSQKILPNTISMGTLVEEVRYTVLEWSS